jgi:hypothetical protein
MEKQISKLFNGATVSDIIINDEFGCVTATINGVTNMDCGWVEDYK